MQGCAKREARKAKCHLAILHLAEIENFINQLHQHMYVALHHPEHFVAVVIRFTVFQQAVHWVGNEGEGRTQLMAHVGEKRELCLRHGFYFVVQPLQLMVTIGQLCTESGLGKVGSISHEDGDSDERQCTDEHCDKPSLHGVLIEVGVYFFVHDVEVGILPFHVFGLHEQQFGIIAGDNRRCERILSLERLSA